MTRFKRIRLAFGILAASALLLTGTLPVQAQATRTWVSGVGDDANPCSRTAPCKTFSGAISKTAVNGEINCLDPGGFGTVTITKSIAIDCHEVFGSTLNSGVNGINIAFDSITDTFRTVRLRNLNVNGGGTGTTGVHITGGGTGSTANTEVFIEDCLIYNDGAGNGFGIFDERSGGGKLFVSNTTVRDTTGTGIVIQPTSGSTRIDATLDNVRVENTNFGTGFNSGAKVMINRSVFSGNTNAGIFASGSTTEVNVDNSVISSNGTGVQNGGGGVLIRLSNNDIAFNSTGISGTTFSYGNNRISGNGSPGTAPTAASPGEQ